MTPVYLDWNLFTGCSMTFFAYQCQINVHSIQKELVQPSYKRISKVIHRSLSIDAVFYLVIAIAGYFSQFDNTAPIVLERPLLPGVDKDYPLMIGIVAVIICIIVAYPLNLAPFRSNFFLMIRGKDECSAFENALLVALYVSGTTFLSIIFPHVSQVISIMGGLIATQLCYTVPLII